MGQKNQRQGALLGVWADPDAALQAYLDVRDDLHAGRPPRKRNQGEITVRELANQFLNAKRVKVGHGQLTPLLFSQYESIGKFLVSEIGGQAVEDLQPADFLALLSKIPGKSPHTLGNAIQRIRTIFKYAYDAVLIDRPVRFGPDFSKPSKTVMRRHRQKRRRTLFCC